MTPVLTTIRKPRPWRGAIVAALIAALTCCGIGYTIGHRNVASLATTARDSQAECVSAQDLAAQYASEADGLRQEAISTSARLIAVTDAARYAERAAKAYATDNIYLTAKVRALSTPKPAVKPPVVQRQTSSARGAIPTLIRAVCRSRGLSAADTAAMVELARRESTFRPAAVNGSCKGLYQLKTTSRYWRDAEWNTNAAIDYVAHRYGSASAALAAHDRKGWY